MKVIFRSYELLLELYVYVTWKKRT